MFKLLSERIVREGNDTGGAGAGTGEPKSATPFDFEAWLATQSPEVQAGHTASVEKLMGALRQEREAAKKVGPLTSDLAAANARIAELRSAEVSLVETQSGLSSMTAARDTLAKETTSLKKREAILLAAVKAQLADPTDALAYIKEDVITTAEDGTFKGAEEAIAALLETKAYLKKAGDGLGNNISKGRRQPEKEQKPRKVGVRL